MASVSGDDRCLHVLRLKLQSGLKSTLCEANRCYTRGAQLPPGHGGRWRRAETSLGLGRLGAASQWSAVLWRPQWHPRTTSGPQSQCPKPSRPPCCSSEPGLGDEQWLPGSLCKSGQHHLGFLCPHHGSCVSICHVIVPLWTHTAQQAPCVGGCCTAQECPAGSHQSSQVLDWLTTSSFLNLKAPTSEIATISTRCGGAHL